MLVVRVADDRGGGGLPGDDAERRQVGAQDHVGEAGIGAADGEGRTGDHLLGDVPAEDHVALGEAFAGATGEKLFGRNAFSAVDAVHIGRADLDGFDAVGGELSADLFGRHGGDDTAPGCAA